MESIDLETLGNNCLAKLKNASFFPFRTGNLRNTTQGNLIWHDTYRIWFNNILAPYVEYLEEGTRPHDIPGAFGMPLPFGIGGRFDGKFHPGSKKHKGFIENSSVMLIVKTICEELGGELIVE